MLKVGLREASKAQEKAVDGLTDTVLLSGDGNRAELGKPARGSIRGEHTTWKEFIQSHLAVLAGIDFFTVEVLTWRGLVTYYVLFFIHLESRRVSLAGITRHPDQAWMQQMARNATGEAWGFLKQCRYALHDRDTEFCWLFRATLVAGGVKPIQLPARSPNFEFSCGALGTIRKGRVLIKADLVRRSIVATGANRLHRSFSHRKKPPRER
jgi:hypothetical protein